MLRGVVFDLDGVIVDSHPLHRRAWRAFLASAGHEVSEADLDFILEGRRRQDILRHFFGSLSDVEIQKYGSQKDELFRQACAALKPAPGSVEFINELKSARLCIGMATSASRRRAQWTLQELNIADLFEVIITGDDVPQSKPDPAIYRLVAQRLSAPPECLFAIEDSVCGVRSAQAAGLRCLGIALEKNVDLLVSAGAERVFPSLVNLTVRDLDETFSKYQRMDSPRSEETILGVPR